MDNLHPLLTLRYAFSEWQRLGRIEALCEEQIRARHRASAWRKITDGRSTFNDYFTPNGDNAISHPDTECP